MNRIALVTGGTGFLGSWLVPALLDGGYASIYVLTRSKQSLSFGNQRRGNGGREAIRDQDNRIKAIVGDIGKPGLSLSRKTGDRILKQVTDVFHAAAVTDFRTPLRSIRLPNVRGTKHMLEFVADKGDRNQQVRFHHISTIGVAGTLKGSFSEDQLDRGQRFHNPYERSKYEAELLARKYREKGMDVRTYRIGILTGDSKRGITTNFQALYQFVHLLAYELCDVLPADGNCRHALVPVDQAASAISLLSKVPEAPPHAWHIVNANEVTLRYFIRVASRVFHSNSPQLIPLSNFPIRRLTRLQWKLIKPLTPYLNYRVHIRADRTNVMLAKVGFRWVKLNEIMLRRIFSYCVRSGYIRK